MNSLFRLFEKNTMTSVFIDQLIAQIDNCQADAESFCRKGPGDGTHENTSFIESLGNVKEKLKLIRTTCHLALDRENTVTDLTELALAFGYDFDFTFKAKTAEASRGTPMTPHSHQPPSAFADGQSGPVTDCRNSDFGSTAVPSPLPPEIVSVKTKKIFRVGDYIRPTSAAKTLISGIDVQQFAAGVFIVCLYPLALAQGGKIWKSSLSLTDMEVFGQADASLITTYRVMLSPEDYASSGKLTRREI